MRAAAGRSDQPGREPERRGEAAGDNPAGVIEAGTREGIVTDHARLRAYHRYGLAISVEAGRELDELVRSADPRTPRLGGRAGGAELVAIRMFGQWVPVVVASGVIITVLPGHALSRYRKMLDRRKKEMEDKRGWWTTGFVEIDGTATRRARPTG